MFLLNRLVQGCVAMFALRIRIRTSVQKDLAYYYVSPYCRHMQGRVTKGVPGINALYFNARKVRHVCDFCQNCC